MIKGLILKMKKFSIFGLNIFDGTSEEYIEFIFNNLEQGKKTRIVSLNSLMILHSIFSKKFKNTIKDSELVFIESVGAEIACKLLGHKINKRIAGIDFFRELLYHIDHLNKTVYLFGGSFDTITKAEKNIKIAFPQLRIVGRFKGYFNKEEEEKINVAIQKASPDFIFVALGSPKQEYWISSNIDKIKIGMGVGGSFDVFASKSKRAPESFIKNGFEWLYRILSNPKKIFLIFPLTIYGLIVLLYSLFYKIKNIFKKVE